MSESDEVAEGRNDLQVFLIGLLDSALLEIECARDALEASRRPGVNDEPELIRKLRVAFRRVEYQLEVIDEVEHSLDATMLTSHLHQAAKPLGRLRDSETLAVRLSKVLPQEGATPKGHHVEEFAIEALRNQQRAADKAIDSQIFMRAVQNLLTFRDSLTAHSISTAPLDDVARRAFLAAWQRLGRDVKRAQHDARDEYLHAVRISAKRMMYVTQAFAPLLGEPAKELIRRLDNLQHHLGTQHDHVIAAAWFREVGQVHPQLIKLTSSIAKDETHLAHRHPQRWQRLWQRVQRSHPRKLEFHVR